MYGSPPSAARDLNLQFPPPPPGPFSHPKEETDHHHNHHQNHHHHHHHQQQQQMSSGLLRYRSAPSTLFGESCEDFVPVRPSSPDADTIFARFLAPELRNEIHEKSGGRGGEGQGSPQFLPPATMEQKGAQQDNEFPSPSQMLYHSQQQPSSGGNYSNLIRHSSSPAGLFSHLNVENGYGMMRGLDGFRNGNVSPGIQAANRLKGQISFSARQASSAAGMMPQISEMGAESSPEESSLGSGGNPGGGSRGYIPGFPVTTWDDSPLISDGFSGIKRSRDAVEGKLVHGLNQPGSQTPELRSSLSGLSSSDMASIEKFLQFQDSVPCKIRAKRGCATHPRSIAERVRRTRISERMRKLQELVPNMDKQTNTADMLDLAVEHIKDLQRQVKGLSDGRASCTCSSGKQKPYLKQGM